MFLKRMFEIQKEKGISTKQWSEESGVSIDTIHRLKTLGDGEKDSTRISTLVQLITPLGVELWELFYIGEKSFVVLRAEIESLKEERDKLLAEKAVLEARTDALEIRVSELKDDIIETHKYYMKRGSTPHAD
jgi:DNA-binding Xre family transcriptional regulator